MHCLALFPPSRLIYKEVYAQPDKKSRATIVKLSTSYAQFYYNNENNVIFVVMVKAKNVHQKLIEKVDKMGKNVGIRVYRVLT